MPSVADYRRFARKYRRLAAMLREPADKRALELMAKGWDKTAEKQEMMQRAHGGDGGHEQQTQPAEAESCCECADG